MTEEQFWNSNPRLMKPYIKAHELTLEENDRLNWYLGQYIMSAIGVVFSDKKHKSTYVDEPILTQSRKQKAIENMTDEEKEFHTHIFFDSLSKMQERFNKSREGV